MPYRFLTIAACGAFVAWDSSVLAQNIAIQQPVIRNFGVGTVVSVPDSGRGFLGRVARAGESRKRFGPFPSGTATGMFREHAGMSTHVRIHDLREMDERLLRQATNSARIPTGRRLTGNAEHAYQTLINRYESRSSRRSVTRPATSVHGEDSSGTGNPTAAMFYRLGQQAEQRGHHALALRHFRIAAKNGSKAAHRRLAR